MFVDIGPYEDRVDEVGQSIERRINIRIDNYDTWSMDNTLAMIVLPMLKQFKATRHGSPGDMQEFSQTSYGSTQFCFDFYAEGDEAAWDAGRKRYGEILDKMIWSFEQILDDNWEEQYWSEKPEFDFDDYPEDEEKEVIPLRWKKEGKCDYEGLTKHQQRINDGLELFGKYYQSLWD